MPEEDPQRKARIGLVTGALATVCSLAVGGLSAFYGMVAADKTQWAHGGMYFVAAALAFGLTANAIWRR